MKSPLIWILFFALFFLHHDFWFWDDKTLLWGFMPIGLAWHSGFSVAAALLWLLALKVAWPSDIEQWADEVDEAKSAPDSENAA